MNEDFGETPDGQQPEAFFCISSPDTEIIIVLDYRDTFSGNDNLVVVSTKARFYGCQVEFGPSLNLETLHQFERDIRRLHTDLNGKLRFHLEDGSLDLEAEMDKFGHIHWSGSVVNKNHDYDLALRFHFTSDQSYLPLLLEQLRLVFQCFPLLPALNNGRHEYVTHVTQAGDSNE